MSQGTTTIEFPFNDTWMHFNIHIVDVDVPILLSLYDMDRLGIYFNNLEHKLFHPVTNLSHHVTRLNGHTYIQWDPIIKCHLTKNELRRLHRRFGHQATDKLMNLFESYDIDNIGPETRRVLDIISRTCDACQVYTQKPRRFKFTLRDDVTFNHTIYADILYIENKPILHVVDKATRFQAAAWLMTVNAESLWIALRRCWIDIYLVPPDIIAHDAGKNFMSRSFEANVDMLHITTKAIPVESAKSMSIVGRCHSPLRKVFKILKKESPDLNDDDALQMSVKAINDSIGPNGLVPTLVVFGALPSWIYRPTNQLHQLFNELLPSENIPMPCLDILPPVRLTMPFEVEIVQTLQTSIGHLMALESRY